MLKDKNIICISSIDWDFVWQQHQAIMSIFTKNNNRVLFIENTGVRTPSISDIPRLRKRIVNWLKGIKGFRKESENLYIYSPLILPFPYFRVARWINRYLLFKALTRWMRAIEFYNPIIFTFLPTPIVLDLIEKIPHEAFIYYCTDNFSATSEAAHRIARYEKRILQKADVVFVMAKNMVDYCLSYNKNVICMPMGVDTEVFLAPNMLNIKPPDELEGINNRIIGYLGGIRHSIDQFLIEYLAKKFPDYTLMFVGPIQTDILQMKCLKNIIFTGQKPHKELPRYIKCIDVCIIPYKKDAYTDNVSPAKLNEYLIMGKPVVSTNLKEIENFNRENDNILYIANDYQDFARLILEAIKQDSEGLRSKRIAVACNNSWDKKTEQMSTIIETAIKQKKELTIDWQKRLERIYKVVHQKIIHTSLILFIVWLTIFYTPLVWFLTDRLKISQEPKKVDCIVVFAGGVGESGKAGQGYEERVKYAVELYKKGYAKKIIFSSGYAYVFKEPLIMKSLAVSLGVPEDGIILEDKAANTYENVKFVKSILDNKKWNEILLVSSPYHMQRSSLVFRKIAKEIKVIYTPIPNSFFYFHGKRDIEGRRTWRQINIQQIKGILHEYLGIVYYYFKGYI